jgi:hypothetical protein
LLLPVAKFALLMSFVHRFLCLYMSVALHQRSDIVQSFILSNFETFEISQEPFIERLKWLLSRVHFPKQQQQDIVASVEVCVQLLTPVIEERRRLQSAVVVADTTTGPGEQHAPGSAAALLDAEEEAQRAAQLAVLMRKEFLLRIVCLMRIIGILTCEQIARLCVLNAPYPVPLNYLAIVLAQQQGDAGEVQSLLGSNALTSSTTTIDA